ncbi:hypothetical protein HGP14_09490 [Rhizobium sp. P32RR-XVIII]|uniref:hypothetical protein n=1 Tax=Rhizobium sp. P32RR-XVIII TaxID=2726738 RepID=UPI0014573EE8|nr:hypothetical protein [Rhizobium sp. P32RR-XVIII]NLS03590.1 hypothetical protein [Rhizobium sp. P32RR-XVIII]
MTSTLATAVRQTKRQMTFHCCDACERVLSIEEIIERHCERCNALTRPTEVREAA